MSFNAADLVATIRLDGVEKVGRDLDGVRGRLNQTDSAVSKVGSTARTVFDGTAVGIGTAATAATVLTAKLFGTGVAYNGLQQTSRAALKTLLGGAEAANAQMDKLDAFARNSPFSKSTFITAQQQLIGFGFEAGKVIPILNSVQNAVAAVGGSNDQISEIVSILAKIRSSGKLTAEDLNQLGERGLDAATLLGQGFGKSAAEIRDSVTKGTLDAGEAIDVLVTQMDTKFAGAASNVKDTFAGTTDRIRAASRDIGAALAEPFVSKNGGGQAVVWGNQVADVLRAVESHIAPIVTMLTARAAPAFAAVTQELDRARVQIRAWDSSRIEDGLTTIGQNGPAIAAVAGAILGVNAGLLRGLPVIGAFVPAISPLAGILGGIALASPEVRDALGDLLGELQPLIPVAVQLAGVVSSGLNAALPVTAAVISLVAGVAGPLVDVLASIPAPVLATITAAVALNVALRSGAPAIQSFVDGAKRIADQVAVQAALAGMEGNTSRAAGAFGAAGVAATGFGNSLKAAFISNPVGLIILGISTAAAILTSVLMAQGEEAKKTEDRIQGYRGTLDETTGAVLRATRAQIEKNLAEKEADSLAKNLSVSTAEAADAILRGGPAYDAMIAKLREVQAAEKDAAAQDSVLGGLGSARADAIGDLITAYEGERGALVAAQEAQRAYNEEQRLAAAAMSELERSNTRLNEALAIARDVSRDATERLSALKLALDELNGGAKSQAEVTRDLNEQTDRLAEVFAAADENGNKLAASLVNSAGVIDTNTAAGRALFDEVGRLNDQMLDAILVADADAKARGEQGVSMETAREIAGRYQGALGELGREAGLSDEQMAGLIGTMLATPEVVAFAVTDDGTVDANKLRLIDLATQIIATPDKQFNVRTQDIPGLLDALRTLGVSITTLPDGRVSVQKDGQSFSYVENELNNLARKRTALIETLTTQGVISAPTGPGPGIRKAGGGPVFGAGTSTSDSILAALSNDEHVWSAAEVRGAGGHGRMAALRATARSGLGLPAFRDGGPVRISVRPELLPKLGPVTLRSSTVNAPGSTSNDDDRYRQSPGFTVSGNTFVGFDEERLIDELESRRFQALAVAGLLKE